MLSTAWITCGLAAYVLAFSAVVIGTIALRSKRRRERTPEKFKLLRGPGETLRKRVQRLDEDFDLWVGGCALVPVLLAGAFIQGATALNGILKLVALAAAVVVLLGGIVTAAVILYRRLQRQRDDHLGYLGERAVAEYLEPLKEAGYRVFHDVPADGATKRFNLDHVTVGPTGVVVIETKTRRKGRARPGFKDHEVIFDGRQLVWPWGEDRNGLEQAVAEANWLSKWLQQRTGVKLAVQPVLTLPGWYVNESPSPHVRVVNSKILPDVVRGRGAVILEAREMDLIARQLDTLCRDVED